MLNLRDHYFIPVRPDGRPVVELRAFTHGLMPRTVPGMMDGFVEDWRDRGVDAWNDIPDRWQPGNEERTGWWLLPEHIGDHFIAPLLGAPAGTCIHQPHVHWTVSCILSSDEPFAGGRNQVVCSELEFPSVLHAAQQWAPLRRFEPVVVPAGEDGFLDAAALENAISDRTAIVFVSHVGFTSGELQPTDVLRSIARRAQQHGALFFVDGYHAASTMPVEVERIGCDGYFGGLLKEASGSSGNAYLYLRDGLEITPRLSGWFGDREPFAFNRSPSPSPDVRRRFLGGTTAVASLYHAVEGVRVLLDAGLDQVREHSLELTARAIEHVDRMNLPLRSPREAGRRGAMVILEVAHADRLSAFLKARHVYTDSRQQRYLRMAPFVWNDRTEVDEAFQLIGEAIESGDYLRTALAVERGPVT